MKKWIKLLKKWGGHAAGATVEVDTDTADSLIESKFAEAHTPAAKKWFKLLKKWGENPVGETVELTEEEAAPLLQSKTLEETTPPDPMAAALQTLLKGLEEGVTGIFQRASDNIDLPAKKSAKAGKRKSLVLVGGLTRNDHGEEEDFGYNHMPEFYREVKMASKKSGAVVSDRLQSMIEQKAPTGMNETVGEEGGFLVPSTLSNRLLERMYMENDLLGRTDSFTMASTSMEFPGLVDDDRATGSRWGGVRGYWLDEAQQKPPSKPKFFQLRMRLHKSAVLVYVTDELLQDASGIALDQWIARRAGDELRFMASDAIINGDGIGKPLGLLKSPALITVPKEAGQANGTITANNISAMWAAMWAPSRQNAVWLVNQEVEPQLDVMFFAIKNAEGDIVGGFPLFMPQGGPGTGNIVGTNYASLKGRPVIPTEFNPELGQVGDIMLVDLSQYMVGTKGGIQSAMSIHLRFDYDETVFRFVFRMDGQPSWNKAVKPYRGSAGKVYSPYVALEKRAA